MFADIHFSCILNITFIITSYLGIIIIIILYLDNFLTDTDLTVLTD